MDRSRYTLLEIDKDSQLASILTDSVPDIRVESAYRYPFLYIVIFLAVICIAVLAVVVGKPKTRIPM